MSYDINDTVLYGTNGVCIIAEITKRKIGNELVEYYILKPIYNEGSTIFVPTANETLTSRMKSIISREELCSAIETASLECLVWIDNEPERKQKYREILEIGSVYDILQLMRTLYLRRDKVSELGKKLYVSDERLLKDTEKIIFDEVAFVLDMERSKVGDFLKERLGLR